MTGISMITVPATVGVRIPRIIDRRPGSGTGRLAEVPAPTAHNRTGVRNRHGVPMRTPGLSCCTWKVPAIRKFSTVLRQCGPVGVAHGTLGPIRERPASPRA